MIADRFKVIISLTQSAERPISATVCTCKVCVINAYNFMGIKSTELLDLYGM
jgi:hypothetical protein